jgi:hypothetical protein
VLKDDRIANVSAIPADYVSSTNMWLDTNASIHAATPPQWKRPG